MTPTMPDDDGAGRGDADIGGAAPGLKPDPAARQPDHDGEGNGLDEAEHELVEWDRVERLARYPGS